MLLREDQLENIIDYGVVIFSEKYFMCSIAGGEYKFQKFSSQTKLIKIGLK